MPAFLAKKFRGEKAGGFLGGAIAAVNLTWCVHHLRILTFSNNDAPLGAVVRARTTFSLPPLLTDRPPSHVDVHQHSKTKKTQQADGLFSSPEFRMYGFKVRFVLRIRCRSEKSPPPPPPPPAGRHG